MKSYSVVGVPNSWPRTAVPLGTFDNEESAQSVASQAVAEGGFLRAYTHHGDGSEAWLDDQLKAENVRCRFESSSEDPLTEVIPVVLPPAKVEIDDL